MSPEPVACCSRLGDAFRQENLKALRLLDKVNEQLASGRIAYVFDRRGQPLAEYDNRSGVSRSLVPGFSVADFVPSLQEGLRFFILGLDGSIQQKVHRLFNPYFGTFLLLDLEEGAILSAYSKSRQPQSPNPVFSDLYEPGSIVKVITLLGYLGAGPTPLFPFTCKGAEIIGNKIFYDVLKHGVVEGAEQALAISCNLAFVRMGRSLGFAKLADTLGRFAFNGQDFSDLFITFRTGRFQSVGSDEYRLANLAVGLDELTLTTFHAALIAALVAQRGQVASPYLIDSVRNILNLGFVNHRVQVQRLLPAEWDFTTLQRAMAEVVASDKGTGRRARVAGVSLALKTGTAGSRAQGLDAVVIGFFPLEKPQYAFAVRLEGAGRAEFNGAFFVRDFLRSFYGD